MEFKRSTAPRTAQKKKNIGGAQKHKSTTLLKKLHPPPPLVLLSTVKLNRLLDTVTFLVINSCQEKAPLKTGEHKTKQKQQ